MGIPDPELIRAADENLAAASSYLIDLGLLPDGTVSRPGDVVIVDSGLAENTYNLIVGARFADGEIENRCASVLESTRSTGRPFAWWVAPEPEQRGLPAVLESSGARLADTQTLMVVEKNDFRPAVVPTELEIRRVDSESAVRDFAKIDAELWEPPNENVFRFFEHCAGEVSSGSYPGSLWVGYVDGDPVSCAEVFLGGGLAGIYNVATTKTRRRRGYAGAVFSCALADAFDDGALTAILQASGAGEALYRQLGFRSLGRYVEFAV